MADEYGAGSTLAVQVTSDVPGAQPMTLDFANNNLNGKSKWRATEFRDYDTSRTRVCVTVGMMTTGYDCEDVLNVVLVRPIFSPTDFIQIKGRGTRLFNFKHGDGSDQRLVAKDGFALFDFFANCEYFEDEFDYDRKLTLPRGPTGEEDGDGSDTGGGGRVESFTNTSLDPLATVVREEIGSTGMKADREMYRDLFERQTLDAVAADSALKDAIESENWSAIEDNIRRLLFEKPDEFWNLPKLQNLFKTDRLPTLREILARVLGFATGIPLAANSPTKSSSGSSPRRRSAPFMSAKCVPSSRRSCWTPIAEPC